MGKILKGVLIGGLVGVAVAGVKAFQGEQPSEEADEGQAAKTVVGAAAVGGVVGLVLLRRDRKRQAKRRLSLGSALTAGGLVEAARAARPALEQAAEIAREKAEIAREKASKAAEAARPTLEQAADVARETASKAAEAAKSRLDDATDGQRPILVRLG